MSDDEKSDYEKLIEIRDEVNADIEAIEAQSHDHACYSCGLKVAGSSLVTGYGCRGCGNTTFLKLREKP